MERTNIIKKYDRAMIIGIGLFLFFSSFIPISMAAKVKTKKTDSKKSGEETLQQKSQKVEQALEKLNNKVWHIRLVPVSTAAQKKVSEDSITFADNRISSKGLLSEGFPAAGYTVSLKGEDTIVWESMQTSEDDRKAFWRGELQGDIMRGVLSRRMHEQTAEEFSFTSIGCEVLKQNKDEQVTPSSQ